MLFDCNNNWESEIICVIRISGSFGRNDREDIFYNSLC